MALGRTNNAGFVQLWKLNPTSSPAVTPGASNSPSATTTGTVSAADKLLLGPDAFNAFSGQGKLAFVREGKLYILNGDSQNLISLNLPPGQVGRLAWSGYGEWLAYTINNEKEKQSSASVWVVSSDGSQNHAYEGFSNFAWMPQVNGDGLELFGKANGEENGIWLTSPGGRPSQKITAAGLVARAEWSPDGSLLAYVTTSLLPSAPSATTASVSSNRVAGAALYTVNPKSGVSTLRYSARPGDCLKLSD